MARDDYHLRRARHDARDASQELRDLRDHSRDTQLAAEAHQRDLDRASAQAAHELRDLQEDARSQRRTMGRSGGGGGGRFGGMGGGGAAGGEDVFLNIAGAVGLVAAAVAALALAVGHISARLFDGAWPSYPADEIPGILGRLVTDLGEPAAAWEPVNDGGQPPGAVGWWLTFVVLVLLLGALGLLIYALQAGDIRNLRKTPAGDEEVGDWAAQKETRRLRASGEDEGTGSKMVVGLRNKQKVGIDPLHSLLVVGPAHAGKTSGLAIPTLLEWDGPAVVASTKSHLMEETIGWRSHQGDVHVFDPAGSSRFQRSGWMLLGACGTWQDAIRMARHLTIATKASVGGVLDGGNSEEIESGVLWTSAMAMALAPFLYAAHLDGRTIIQAAEWIEREERDEVLRILEPVDQAAAHAHETTFFRENESRSTFFHIMYQVLSVYGDPIVAETAERHEVVVAELLDGGRHTWYLTAPEHDQVRFRPLFATIVRHVLARIDDRFAATGSALDPPLLLLLDDAVGVATLEGLANAASTGVTKGVQVVSVFEDLSRFEAANPDALRVLARSHRAHLMLPGSPYDELLAPNLAAQLEPGEGALDYGERPVRLRLRRWYDDRELKRRVEMAQDVLTPNERRAAVTGRSPATEVPEYTLIEQTSAWRRRRRNRDDSPESVQDPVVSASPLGRRRNLGNVFATSNRDGSDSGGGDRNDQ